MPTSHGTDTQNQGESVTTEAILPPMVIRYIEDGCHLKLKSVRLVDNLTFSFSDTYLVGKYKDKRIMGRTYPDAETYEDFVALMDKFIYKFLDDLSIYVYRNFISPSLKANHD